MNTTANTREQLLDHAQCLIKRRGYNGFSYRDLAEHVGVKTASIHYYFPAKDDLLIAVIDRHTEEIRGYFRDLDSRLPAKERLFSYIDLFLGGPSDQICLCGVLAADFASLSDRSRQSVQAFFHVHEGWVSRVIAEGVTDGTLKSTGDTEIDGRWVFAALQGGLLGSRLFQDRQRLENVRTVVERMHVVSG